MGLTRDQELRLLAHMAAHLEATDGTASIEQLTEAAMEECAVPAAEREAVERLAAALTGQARPADRWWRAGAGLALAAADLDAALASLAVALGAS
jgi:hypothetical protein